MPRLTRTLVEKTKAQPGGAHLRLWDDDVKGFGAQVTSKGVRSWIVRYRSPDGKKRQMAIGRVADISADEARKIAARIKTEVAAGGDPLREKRALRAADSAGPTDLTVAVFAERFYQEHCAPQKSAAESRRKLDVEILPRIGSLALDSVRPIHIQEIHQKIGADRPILANRVRALLSTLFEHAERLELRPLGTNPVRPIKKFPENKAFRWLTLDEMKRFAEGLAKAVEERPSRSTPANAIRLLFLTGCRRNEVFERRWEDYDPKRKILHLTDSKVGPRDVVLGAPAIQLLESLPRDSEWIFPAMRGGGHLGDVRKTIDRACALAKPKLKTFTPHVLRHTFVTHGAQVVNGPQLQGVVGHSKFETTERYLHLADDHLRRAADVMEENIARALDGDDQGADVLAFRKRGAE